MSEVQAATLPFSLQGLDVFAKAKTGSGKTLSFLIPIADRLLSSVSSKNIRALVLSPSRELADQTRHEANKLLTHMNIGVQLVIGGEDMKKQKRALNTLPCDILVATPGRLQDHIKNFPGFADRLRNVEVLVLDECDRLLDGGFQKDIEFISKYLPKTKQTLLFTATVPKGVQDIANAIMKGNAKTIDVTSGSDNASHTRISQEYLCVPTKHVIAHLHRVLRYKILEPGFRIICFFVNVGMTKFMAELFRQSGMPVLEMHSDLSQNQRTQTAAKFAAKPGHILFASDVIARGIDFPDVTLVIQVGFTDVSQYEHRVGRTGRAGKSGQALMILSTKEKAMLQHLRDMKMPISESKSNSKITHGATSDSAVRRASALIDVIENLSQNKNRDMRKTAQSAYRSMLGSYASKKNFLKMKKDDIMEMCGDFIISAGLEEIPEIKPETMRKMGLQ